MDQEPDKGEEALKNLFGKLAVDVEAEPLNGGENEKPRRQGSNHHEANDEDVNNIVGNFFGGNMMNKEVYQDDEPVQIKEGEGWQNLFMPNGGHHQDQNQNQEDPAIGGIHILDSKSPERQRTLENEEKSARPLLTSDSGNIRSKDSNEDTDAINRSQTVSRRIIPKHMDQN